jgi:hypothetical protein
MLAAGIYGTFTAAKRTFFVQVVPALLALVFVLPAARPSAGPLWVRPPFHGSRRIPRRNAERDRLAGDVSL